MNASDPPTDVEAIARGYWDLWLAAGVVVTMAALALIPGTAGHPIRIGMAVLYVLFVPGYAFVSALFPEEGTVTGLERFVFAFVLSVGLTALLTLGLNFTPWGIRLQPVVFMLTTFSLVGLIVAGVRRNRLQRMRDVPRNVGDETSRDGPFVVPFDHVWSLMLGLKTAVTGRNTESHLENVLTLALVASILLAGASVGWALTTPRPGSEYTEFYLLTADEEDELIAGGYPTNLSTRTPSTVFVGINNHEFDTVTYRVLVRLRDPTTSRTERLRIISDIRLGHNGTWMEHISVTPTFTGDRLRLEFLLYRDVDPDTPYRRLHLIVNVSHESTPDRVN